MMITPENIFKRVSYVKIFAFSFLSLIIGVVFAGMLLPRIIRFAMKSQLRLTPGTQTRDMFVKVPFAIDFNLYLWNVTNKDEVMTGAKPILQEIGPYYFEEYKDKIDIVDDNEEDTIEYDYRNTYIYHPEKNGPGLTGEEIVTVAHPLILAMILAINVDKEELLPFIMTAVNGMLRKPTDIFFTGRLWDLLYDGIEIDCSSDAFEITAVCSEFDSGDYKEIRRINDTTFKFAFFGFTNGTSIGRFKALRGKKNIRDIGRVLEFNGESEMDAWFEDECNRVDGTDGTIFAPFYEKEEGFSIYVPQMCRKLLLEYQRPSKYAGIKTNLFSLSFDVSRYGSPNCYCRSDEYCPPEGVFDLFPCSGAPIAITKPHFYEVDLAEREKVVGLNPIEEKHNFALKFYQFAGAPVSAIGRAQVNFEIVPIESVDMMKDLQKMYLPLLWFEEGVNLSKKYTNLLLPLIFGLKFQKILKFGGILGGIVGLGFGAVACYMQMDDKDEIKDDLSAKSDTQLNNPKVQSIEVVSNE
ncbi:sensory neuron membrane protein 1-like [Contarinia nasturtii]|uniref:sensory neuron membrane protein 1-like n=1 Tax=Contarinia nasturtii TaxID=265458 RepID=UPI0012D46766|nr:sensory neuron membrane protein 1-like [Contarinia nasturtii]